MEELPGMEVTNCWVTVEILGDVTMPLVVRREGRVGIPADALRLISQGHGLEELLEAMASFSGVRERRRIQPSLN